MGLGSTREVRKKEPTLLFNVLVVQATRGSTSPILKVPVYIPHPSNMMAVVAAFPPNHMRRIQYGSIAPAILIVCR